MRLFCVLAWAMFAVSLAMPVQAASFDCAAAASDFETTVCGDAELSRMDDVLAVAYATAGGGLGKKALETLRQDQRDWLGFAADTCLGGLRSGVHAGAPCLVAAYRDRLEVLEQSRMIGEFRFYVVSDYASLPDPDYADTPDSAFSLAVHEFSAPMIDGSDTVARGFNTMLADLLAARGDQPSLNPEISDSASNTMTTISVEEVRPSRISLKEYGYWYGHGAAHGNYTYNYLHYLTEAGRLLQAEDVFEGSGWQRRLATATSAALTAEHGDNLFGDTDIGDIEAIVADPTRWSFGDYGLIVQFQPYEVAAYAFGAPSATVGWDEIDDILAPGNETIRYGF